MWWTKLATVSFLLHVKYTQLHTIVSYQLPQTAVELPCTTDYTSYRVPRLSVHLHPMLPQIYIYTSLFAQKEQHRKKPIIKQQQTTKHTCTNAALTMISYHMTCWAYLRVITEESVLGKKFFQVIEIVDLTPILWKSILHAKSAPMTRTNTLAVTSSSHSRLYPTHESGFFLLKTGTNSYSWSCPIHETRSFAMTGRYRDEHERRESSLLNPPPPQ